MNALKTLIAIVFMAFLAACSAASSGPTDEDVDKVAQHYMREANSTFARQGLSLDKVVTMTPKIKNKAQNGDVWNVEVEMTTKPKIDPATASTEDKMMMSVLGVPTKDSEFKQTVPLRMQKGSNGWMLVFP